MNDVKIGLPNKRDALQGPKNRESQLEKKWESRETSRQSCDDHVD